MRPKQRLLLFCIVLLLVSCQKETITLAPNFIGEVEFTTTLGGSKNEVAKSVVATRDGGYAILGYVQSNDFDFIEKEDLSFDFVVLKYDSNDSLLWKKILGGSNDDRGSKLVHTDDGGFVVLGYSKSKDRDVSNNSGDRDFWVAKINEEGTLLWEQSYGYQGRDFGTSMIETSDDGFLLVGELDVTASGGEGNKREKIQHAGGDFWVIKLNSSGKKEWSKYYGGTFTDTPSAVLEAANNNFLIVGASDSKDIDISNNLGGYDYWIIKIDALGNLIWERSLGGSEIDRATAIAATEDNNFLICGNTRSSDVQVSNNKGGADVWVIKLSSEGKLLWEKSIGGSDFDAANTMKPTQDGNFLIAGSTRSSDAAIENKGQNDAWMVKIDPNGIILWQTSIGGSEIDVFYDAIELSNRKIVAVGESNSSNNDIFVNRGFSDMLISKLK